MESDGIINCWVLQLLEAAALSESIIEEEHRVPLIVIRRETSSNPGQSRALILGENLERAGANSIKSLIVLMPIVTLLFTWLRQGKPQNERCSRSNFKISLFFFSLFLPGLSATEFRSFYLFYFLYVAL